MAMLLVITRGICIFVMMVLQAYPQQRVQLDSSHLRVQHGEQCLARTDRPIKGPGDWRESDALPSDKRLQNYGKSPFLMGKPTISMAMFNSELLVYQRVPKFSLVKSMVKSPLLGGFNLPLWKMMDFVNGKDDIPYMKWKIQNVWNHQPDH